MAASSIPTDPLLRFRAFAAEVAEILDQLAAGTLLVKGTASGSNGSNGGSKGTGSTGTAAATGTAGSAGGAAASDPSTAPAIYDAVRIRLVPYLAPLTAGTATSPLTEPARYLMAAFGDDTFLNLVWPGQVAWQRSTLEKQFFGTDVAATEILSRIDQLLAAPGPRALPLAKMYLIALALGFEGALRGTADAQAMLAEKRRGLGAMISAGDPPEPGAAGRLFPDGYRHTLEGGKPKSLPRAAVWALALVAVLLFWWGLSWPLWHNGTAGLRSILQSLLPAS
ncbi:MAG TPA: DotU family type IV/VI secretion system protein [Thermoanaerobaculia bacterium]|jgi:type IV/VI secretion system ImpK/VasF family protein|nr:DotU family type IV/VI secretion system protein [Thermoanaerobaculia bacterium]